MSLSCYRYTILKRLSHLLLIAALSCTFCAPAEAANRHKKKKTRATVAQKARPPAIDFKHSQEVAAFIAQMTERHGYQSAQLSSLFGQVQYQPTAVQLVRPAPPGQPKNWKAYRARFVEPRRIDAGLAFWDQYADALARAAAEYGVPAEIIVGLIGVETLFGKTTGAFRVMDVLSTLAFAYPDTPNRQTRMHFFRSELEQMLLLARETGLDPFSYKGSYAGAIGWAQFMPGSIRKYAVDFDGDGKIDLSGSAIDAIGSVAHYLAEHGWKKNLPVAFPATLSVAESHPDVRAAIAQGLQVHYPLNQLKAIASTASEDVPENILYGLIDLQNGAEADEYWLATENFYAITRYNRSYFYAMSVFDLGRVIHTAKTK